MPNDQVVLNVGRILFWSLTVFSDPRKNLWWTYCLFFIHSGLQSSFSGNDRTHRTPPAIFPQGCLVLSSHLTPDMSADQAYVNLQTLSTEARFRTAQIQPVTCTLCWIPANTEIGNIGMNISHRQGLSKPQNYSGGIYCHRYASVHTFKTCRTSSQLDKHYKH